MTSIRDARGPSARRRERRRGLGRARATARRGRGLASEVRSGRAAADRFRELGRRGRAAVYRARCAAAPRGARRTGQLSLHARHPPHRLPGPAVDHATVRRVRRAPWTRTRATSSCWRTARRGSRSPSTSRLSWATTPTIRGRRARSGSAASRSRASPTWRRSSTASRSTKSRRR